MEVTIILNIISEVTFALFYLLGRESQLQTTLSAGIVGEHGYQDEGMDWGGEVGAVLEAAYHMPIFKIANKFRKAVTFSLTTEMSFLS